VTKPAGTVALVGGDEWTEPCTPFDARLLELSGTDEVVVLPTAAAFEHPDRAVDRATAYFAALGARVTGMPVLNRRDADTDANISAVRVARFIYIADGSPLHLRSVLKSSAFYDAIVYAYGRGAVIAASGAGATVLGDPMVDPRGGAYTVGLGLVPGLAIFPYHGRAAEHLRERSVDLLARDAVLVGVDEQTALVRTADGPWEVMGRGGATVYRNDEKPKTVKAGAPLDLGTVGTSGTVSTRR
jgi:cyanophycinase